MSYEIEFKSIKLATMESAEKVQVNGNSEKTEDVCEQYEPTTNGNIFLNHDHMDNKSLDFEMNFNGNGVCTDDGEHDFDDNER